MGGWITMAGCCSSGFSPPPSGGEKACVPVAVSTASKRNGLAPKLFSSRKKNCTTIRVAMA